MSEQKLTLTLPPGPLGVSIQLRLDDDVVQRLVALADEGRSNDPGETGAGPLCVVTSKNDPNSMLEPNDVILSLNGITLSDVTGGLGAWVTLFGAFAERSVVVLRRPMTTNTHINTSHVAQHPPLTAQQQQHQQPQFQQQQERFRFQPDMLVGVQRQQLAFLQPRQQKATAATEITTTLAVGGPLRSLPLSLGNAPAAAVRSGGGGTVATKKMKYNKSARQQAKEAGKRKSPLTTLTQEYKKTKSAPVSVISSGVAKKRDDDFEHDDNYMKLLADGYPDPGRVSSCLTYYVANNGDSLSKIAEKIGLSSWKLLNDVEFNRRFYGVLTGRTILKRDTVIKIPTSLCSDWKLSKLVDNQIEDIKTMATCSKCLKKERPDDTEEMLMCDGCDIAIHVSCAGLLMVPDGDWLCGACLDILDARKKSLATDKEGDRRSLMAKLPPLPKLDDETAHMVTKAKMRFREEMLSRKSVALSRLEENQGVMAVASKARVSELENEVREADAHVADVKKIRKSAWKVAMVEKHGEWLYFLSIFFHQNDTFYQILSSSNHTRPYGVEFQDQ